MKTILNTLTLCFFIIKTIHSQTTEGDKKESDDVTFPQSLFDEVPGRRIIRMAEIEKLSNSSDFTFFLYTYSRDSLNSRKGIVFLKSVAKKLNNLVEFLFYDCTDNVEKIELCLKKNSTDGFPRMIAFVAPEYRINPYTKEINYHSQVIFKTGSVNELLIYNFITENIISHTIKLNSENFESFMK